MDEIGPAHKKTFFITLKLGVGSEAEEAYTANGSSIKNTQHAAAELALSKTKFKIPTKRNKAAEATGVERQTRPVSAEHNWQQKRAKNKVQPISTFSLFQFIFIIIFQ